MAGKSPVWATPEQVRLLEAKAGGGPSRGEQGQKHPLDAQGLDQFTPFGSVRGA
jgi:hypothetical protein